MEAVLKMPRLREGFTDGAYLFTLFHRIKFIFISDHFPKSSNYSCVGHCYMHNLKLGYKREPWVNLPKEPP